MATTSSHSPLARGCFANVPDVAVSHGDIFDEPADAIVSPANSFGFMHGGIDLAYSLRFGWELQDRLQAQLHREHDGELPVGQAVVIETGDAQFPWLISAPTMRVPMDVSDSVNAFLAFRAVIRSVRQFNERAARPIRSVLCPGLARPSGGWRRGRALDRCIMRIAPLTSASPLSRRT